MKSLNYLQKYSVLTFALALLFCASAVNDGLNKPLVVISKQDKSWNLNDKMIQNFHLGFKRLTSSFLWISTILESDIDHYNKKDLNSWMFLRFKTIAELEPRFYENYAFGGIYLSIIKDDLQGASFIFNRGLEKYPLDYPLLRDASYHFYYEEKNYSRAYQITQVVKKHYPQKHVLIGMMTKLEAENGKLENALASLTEFQKSYPKGNPIGDKIFQNRYSLKAEIDLDCLNKLKDTSCSLYDLNGVPYIKTNHGFSAQAEWKPYRRKSLQ